MAETQHHICCNYHNLPIGGPGCICAITTKKEKKELEEVRQIMQEWGNQPDCWNSSELLARIATTLGLKHSQEKS